MLFDLSSDEVVTIYLLLHRFLVQTIYSSVLFTSFLSLFGSLVLQFSSFFPMIVKFDDPVHEKMCPDIDIMEIPDIEVAPRAYPSLLKPDGKYLSVQLINLTHHECKEVSIKLDRIVDPCIQGEIFPTHAAKGPTAHVLSVYRHELGPMTDFFAEALNPGATCIDITFEE